MDGDENQDQDDVTTDGDENLDETDGSTTEGDNAKSGDNSDENSDTGTETDETSDDSDPKAADTKAADDGKDENQRTSAYIRRLKREKRQAERALEEERKRADTATAKASQKPEPKREDFETDEAYIDAKVEYEVAKKAPATDAGPAPTGYARTFIDAGINKADAKFLSESMVEAQTSHKNFVEATTKANGLSREVFEGLVETDNPGEVLFYLSTHQKELSRISGLGDAKAIAVQLGRVEERMELSAKKNDTSRTVSSAPDPIRPVGGGKDVPGDENSDKLTDDEFFARRNKELKEQRGIA